MFKKIMFIILVIFISISIGYAVKSISSCTTINEAFLDSSRSVVMTSNINTSSTTNCIDIQVNNVSFNCNGYTIAGNNVAQNGIRVLRTSPVQNASITISNCFIRNWSSYAVRLEYVKHINLTNINFSNKDVDVLGYYTGNITLENITSNGQDSSVTFFHHAFTQGTLYFKNVNLNTSSFLSRWYEGGPTPFCNLTVENVTDINLRPVVIYKQTTNISNLNNNVSQIILCNASNSIINNITLNEGFSRVIYDEFSSNIRLTNSSFNYSKGNFVYGISNWYVDNVSIMNARGSVFDTINSNNYFNNIYFENNSNYDITSYTSPTGIRHSTFQNLIFNNTVGIRLGGFAGSNYNNTFTNITSYNSDYGIRFTEETTNTTIDNFTIISPTVNGIDISNAKGNITIKNSKISGATNYGIYIYYDATASNKFNYSNNIYNNLFNNSVNIYYNVDRTYQNYFNTTLQTGITNIYNRENISGNFWANPSNSGFSQICLDSDSNGFCDTTYTLADQNIDEMPIAQSLGGTDYNYNVSSCRALLAPGIHNLTANISNTVTSNCISVLSDNVTLNCLGNTIDGDDNADVGIDVGAYFNFTIINCRISDFDVALIRFSGTYNSSINNLTLSSSDNYGISLLNSNNNILQNLSIFSNSNAVYFSYSYNSTLFNSRIYSNSNEALDFRNSQGNIIYNNLLNNSLNTYFSNSNSNYFNTTFQVGTNIIGGSNIYGNVWTNSPGTSISNLCMDSNSNSICDNLTYSSGYLNTDYGPIAINIGKNTFNYNISSCITLFYPGEYILISNITNSNIRKCVQISAQNLTLECNNNFLDGNDNTAYGIYMTTSNNITIKNCKISDWITNQIVSENSQNIKILNGSITSSTTNGINLYEISNLNISNINISNNGQYGIYGTNLHNFSLSHLFLDSNIYGGIYIFNTNNLTIENITTMNSSNTFYGSGVFIYNSSNIYVNYLNSSNNYQDGIRTYTSIYNLTINNSYFNYNRYGISIELLPATNRGTNFTITNSRFYNHSLYSIFLYNLDSLTNIYNNYFSGNNVYGGEIDNSTLVFFNTSNITQTNIVSGPYLGGNFYANSQNNGFSENCTVTTLSGFCDDPYTSFELGLTDYLPLTYLVYYTNPTPGDNTLIGGLREQIINVTSITTTVAMGVCNFYINGIEYNVTSTNSYCFLDISNLTTPLNQTTFYVKYNNGNSVLAERTFTYYPDYSAELFPTYSLFSGIVSLILLIFGVIYLNKK